jgi:hypothetical protein
LVVIINGLFSKIDMGLQIFGLYYEMRNEQSMQISWQYYTNIVYGFGLQLGNSECMLRRPIVRPIKNESYNVNKKDCKFLEDISSNKG